MFTMDEHDELCTTFEPLLPKPSRVSGYDSYLSVVPISRDSSRFIDRFPRFGFDRIMLTVRKDGDFKKKKFPKIVAMKFGDRTGRLKFADRSAETVRFTKYPDNSIKGQAERFNGDVEEPTPAVAYNIRLDGFRQMRVFLNCQRLYNYQHGLEPHKQRLYDDNVIDAKESYCLQEFMDMVRAELPGFKRDYCYLRREVFGDEVHECDVVIDTHVVEVVQEVHADLIEYEELLKNIKCKDITVYRNQTQTTYLNLPGRNQIKLYQKALGLLRMEYSLNFRPNDVTMSWQSDDLDSRYRTVFSIEYELKRLLSHAGLPENWYDYTRTRRSDKLDFVGSWAAAYDISKDQMLNLLGLRYWVSRKDNRNMTRKLVRCGLLFGTFNRAVYAPTARMDHIRMLYNGIVSQAEVEQKKKEEEQG